MLTKDLVKFRTRGTRVYPKLLEADEARWLALAGALHDTLQAHVGDTLANLEADWEDVQSPDPIVKKGFMKLLRDKADLAEAREDIAEARWQALEAAETLRTSRTWASLADYTAAVAEAVGATPAALAEGLYADLPDFQTVEAVPDLSPEALVRRFNVAQVQGLLLRAETVTVTLEKAPLAARRRFFRMIKFFQLLVHVEKVGDARTVVRLSGPMTMFDATQTYSLRMAQLFPALLGLGSFTLEADVKVKDGVFRLVVDDPTPYTGPETAAQGHAPDEGWDDVLAKFRADNPGWEARLGEDVLNLGREQYLLPDVVLSRGKSVIHVELFHRWHSGTFASRLAWLEANGRDDVRLGLCRSLKKNHDAACAASAWFGRNGFFYRDLPSAKALTDLLPPR